MGATAAEVRLGVGERGICDAVQCGAQWELPTSQVCAIERERESLCVFVFV